MSKLRTNLAVDDPVELTGSYKMGSADRRKIDDQVIDLQQMMVDGLLNGAVCSWYTLSDSSAPLTAGMAFCIASDGLMTKALAGALADAGCSAGLAMTAVAPGAKFRALIAGVISPDISGLGAGTASNVRINTTSAMLERVGSPGPDDFLIGFADVNGSVTVRTAPGATGQPGSDGKAVQVTTVITANVASLSAAPASNNGYVFLTGDVLALAFQSNSTHNKLYATDGAGHLTALTAQPDEDSLLRVTKGSTAGALWYYNSGAITPQVASVETVVGANGTIIEAYPDPAGLTTPGRLINRGIDKIAITAGATAVVHSYDCNAEQRLTGRFALRAEVTLVDSSNDCLSFLKWVFRAGAPPAHLFAGAQDDVDDTSSGSSGSGGYLSLSVAISGNAVQLSVKNNLGSTVHVVGEVSGTVWDL